MIAQTGRQQRTASAVYQAASPAYLGGRWCDCDGRISKAWRRFPAESTHHRPPDHKLVSETEDEIVAACQTVKNII